MKYKPPIWLRIALWSSRRTRRRYYVKHPECKNPWSKIDVLAAAEWENAHADSYDGKHDHRRLTRSWYELLYMSVCLKIFK